HRSREAYAGVDVDLVALELGATAPAVPLPPPCQVQVDVLGRQGHPGRHPFHNADECLPVRLTGRHVSYHERLLAIGYWLMASGRRTLALTAGVEEIRKPAANSQQPTARKRPDLQAAGLARRWNLQPERQKPKSQPCGPGTSTS